MLVLICGPRRAGKKTLQSYMLSELGFHTIIPSLQTVHQQHTHALFDRISEYWLPHRNAVLLLDHLIHYNSFITTLLKRPWVLIVHVDAPLLTRYERHCQSAPPIIGHDANLEHLRQFIAQDDSVTNLRVHNHCHLSSNNHVRDSQPHLRSQRDPTIDPLLFKRLAHIHIYNDFESVSHFHNNLQHLDFSDPRRLRPSWDTYFMSLARLAAQRTNCMKRKVGCVITRNHRVVATGYNGTPTGVKNCHQGGCPRCNNHHKQGVALDLCLCLHAEENAIIEAGRDRCQLATLYTTVFPCILCSKKIVQAGVSRVVFDTKYSSGEEPAHNLLEAGGVAIDCFQSDQNCARLTSLACSPAVN
ncbi:Deoxycytidylate deaminase [Gracilariopsis chorda]|uniref:Deoxycytidylate deaminase n=1 Tax=Gracilariopsis chorda TaxID=448386 RepID=A0A2V3IJX5_9FLOR|nr:Deoxycytidylate deaminase [Gracilariopsis chorda]|eukprot:PXF42377.1 Deoxycytidylate deaminase [Gracilariopsis chorda]